MYKRAKKWIFILAFLLFILVQPDHIIVYYSQNSFACRIESKKFNKFMVKRHNNHLFNFFFAYIPRFCCFALFIGKNLYRYSSIRKTKVNWPISLSFLTVNSKNGYKCFFWQRKHLCVTLFCWFTHTSWINLF